MVGSVYKREMKEAPRPPLITSNVVFFSEWDRIFKDPMTTAAVIDRLVHRSVIEVLARAEPAVVGSALRNDGAQSSIHRVRGDDIHCVVAPDEPLDLFVTGGWRVVGLRASSRRAAPTRRA